MKWKPILSAMALLTTLSACGKEVKTMTLQPAVFKTLQFQQHNEADWACFPFTCFFSHGLGCAVTVNPATRVQAGFDYRADDGTAPCNCWWYVDCVFRGGVRFNLAPLNGKTVIGAQLHWDARGSCVAKLYVPNKNWDSFSLSTSGEVGSPWAPSSSGAGQLEVGSTVRDWVEGTQPNFGWIFAGPDETFPNWQWREGDAEIGPGNTGTHKCTSGVGGFTLVVQFTD